MSKAKRNRRLAAEEGLIRRRLARAVAPNTDGPVIGRANIA